MSAALVKALLAANQLLRDNGALQDKQTAAERETCRLEAALNAQSGEAAAAAAAAAAAQAEGAQAQRNLGALVETLRAQLADATAVASRLQGDCGALLATREASHEGLQTRIRGLERALHEAQAEAADVRAAHTAQQGLLAAVQAELRGVQEAVAANDDVLAQRKALLEALTRDSATALALSTATTAQVAALQTDVEAKAREEVERARADAWRACGADASRASNEARLEAERSALQAGLEETARALAQANEEKQATATRASEVAAALQQSSEACAAVQAELRRQLDGKRKRDDVEDVAAAVGAVQ